MAERLTIARLGAGGDGVAETDRGDVFVPFALPGETVTISRGPGRARLDTVVVASPDRIDPFCPYYGRCGGCVAQHIGPDLYGEWKREKVASALERAGLTAAVEPLRDTHGAGRRRVVLHARVAHGAIEVGFMEAKSHRLIPIESCPITVPALSAAPGVAKALAGLLLGGGKPLDIAVTATVAGLDVDLRGSGDPGETRRQRLIALAAELDLARLSLHGDALVERRPPASLVGSTMVVPPPGGFLQATEAGEAVLVEAVVAGVGPAKRVVDLFAGIGPFSLGLARTAEVHAVEAERAMSAALDRAARAATGLRRVTTETRDLFRRPLLPGELDRFDALVLDPPRSGAEAQIGQVIPSSLDTVVMVSCDPGTFARDGATLVMGGFAIERVLPVDQFKWSAHVEMVGVFRRARRRRR